MQVLSSEYCKMFKTTYFEKHLQAAAFRLLQLFTVTWPNGLRSTLYGDVRLQSPSHRSNFLFLSRQLSY